MASYHGFRGHNSVIDYATSRCSFSTQEHSSRSRDLCTTSATIGPGTIEVTTLLRNLPPIHQYLEKLTAETQDPPHAFANPPGWLKKKSFPLRENIHNDTQDAYVATTSTRSKIASVTRKTRSAGGPLDDTLAQKDIHQDGLQPDSDLKAEKRSEHAEKEHLRRIVQSNLVNQLHTLLSEKIGYTLEKGQRNTVERNKIFEGSVDAIKEFWDLLTALCILLPELTKFQKHCQTLDSVNSASANAIERVLGILYSHPRVLTPTTSNQPSPTSSNAQESPFTDQKKQRP
ncbi:MAG: hypothetical protein Q9191_000121 [Dirinaria sp. TL-2023a]